MRERRRRRGALFWVFLTLTVVWVGLQAALLTAAPGGGPQRATVEQTNKRPTAEVGGDPSLPTTAQFRVSYPSAVRVNSDAVITLSYVRGRQVLDVQGGSGGMTFEPFRELDGDVKATLIAPGFALQEGTAEQKRSGHAALPTSFQWTVMPQKAGQYTVALDVTDLVEGSQWNKADILTTAVSGGSFVKQLELVDTTCCQIRFPVEVRTEWGLSDGLQRVIGALLTIITTVLGLSFVSDGLGEWLKNRFRKPAP